MESEKADLTNVLGLFSFLEAICLYDKVCLYVADETESETGFRKKKGLFSRLPKGKVTDSGSKTSLYLRSTAKQLVAKIAWGEALREEAISFVKMDDVVSELNVGPERQKRAVVDLLLHSLGLLPDQVKVYYHLALCRGLGLSYLPAPDEVEVLAASAELKRSRAFAGALGKAYGEMSRSSRQEITRLLEAGRHIDLFIPPIPALILSHISDPAELEDATLNLRHEMGPLRTAFREYEQTVQDDSTPLKESLKALQRLEAVSREATKAYDSRGAAAVAEWRDILDVFPSKLEDMDLDSLQEGKLVKFLLGKPLSQIAKALKFRRIIYLARLKERFLNIRHYGSLMQRVYGVELNPQQVKELGHRQEWLDDRIREVRFGPV
jgi:hypothetical protein